MENKNFIEKLADILGQNATVKNVYGDAIVVKDKTIIPVAKVSYGFGGGFGSGKSKKEFQNENTAGGDKGGGGGGLSARAAGVYEITGQKTKFIPANMNRQLILAACFGSFSESFLGVGSGVIY